MPDPCLTLNRVILHRWALGQDSWEIAKATDLSEPDVLRVIWADRSERQRVIIGIFQEATEHGQACSECGVIKPYDAFHLCRGSKSGHNKSCKDCIQAGRKLVARQKLEASDVV